MSIVKDTPLGPVEVRTSAVIENAQYALEQKASKRLLQEIEVGEWKGPDDEDNVGSLADQLLQERVPDPQLIDGLLGAHHNLSLTAQYKTGKTTFGLNCTKAMVDGEDFLGRKTALPDDKTVQWWNMEMDRDDWEEYVRPVGIGRTDRIVPKHLRGRPVPILTEAGRRWTIKALKEANTAVWWIDSWRVLCAWNGVHENDNSGGGLLTQAIDEIKTEANVEVCGLLVHTGRMQHEEGEERSRGMTALDDWVDARWILTRQAQTRYFMASGRRIRWEGTGTALVFDAELNKTMLGSGDRKQSREVEIFNWLYTYLNNNGETNQTKLIAAMRAAKMLTNTQQCTDAIGSAYAAGVISLRLGERRSNMYTAVTPYETIIQRRQELVQSWTMQDN